MKITGEKVTENIYRCPDGVYRWVYELNMLRNPVILITVFKVLGISALAVCAFVLGVDLIEDGRITLPASGEWKVLLLIVLGLIALIVISYLILTAIYGWKYIVLFEMDEEKVVHIQMPKQYKKALALGWLTAMAGLAARSITTAGVGVLSAAKDTSTSRFEDVRTVKAYPRRHLIKVNERLEHNQVYAAKEDFAFVKDYIVSHCPNIKQ